MDGMKYIFVLKLLVLDPASGELFLDEVARVEDLSFQTCVENVVYVVNTFDEAGLRYEVYCEDQKIPSNKGDEKEGDK